MYREAKNTTYGSTTFWPFFSPKNPPRQQDKPTKPKPNKYLTHMRVFHWGASKRKWMEGVDNLKYRASGSKGAAWAAVGPIGGLGQGVVLKHEGPLTKGAKT